MPPQPPQGGNATYIAPGPGVPPPPGGAGFAGSPNGYQKPSGSKKGLFIGIGAACLLALMGVAAFFLMKPKEGSIVHYDRYDGIENYIVTNAATESTAPHGSNFLSDYGDYPLAIALMWERSKDLDLYVVDPAGNCISWSDTYLPPLRRLFRWLKQP